MGGLLRQIVATLIISYSAVNMGILFAWPAFTIRLFGSDATPLNRPMTQAEISLFGSLSSVGALISTPSAGFLLDKLGRWRCSLINAVLITCVWVILILAYYVEAILFAIFLSGVSSSIFLVGGVYISEVCQDSIRGGMTAINIVCYGVGMLLSYLLGGYLQYDIMLYVGQTLTVCCVAVLYLVKESPMFLLKTGREEEATKVVAYYRNLKASSKEVLEVVNAMKRTLNPELEASSPEEEQLQSDTKPVESQLSHTKLSTWQFFKKSPSTRRATFVTFVLMFCSCFQGLVVVMIYAEDLFSQAMPGTPPTLSCVMLALTLVLAGLVAAYLTEVAGRRTLMIYASLASALCCLGLGTQLQFHWGPNWMTAVFIYVFSVMSSFGAGTVPYVLIAELFLPEVKSILSMIVVEWAWVCNFVILFAANPIVTTLGWGPVFYTFMIIGLLTALFCFFFLPETKGLTVEAMQLLFVKRRKTPAIY